MKYAGIYTITQISTGLFYIGSSKNIYSRLRGHKSSLVRGVHHNYRLQAAWIECGEKDFRFEAIEKCEAATKESLIEREQYYIDTLNPFFNVFRVAGSNIGHAVSDETKAKISAAHTGKKLSPERVEEMRQRRASDETRRKISESQLGRKASDETRARMSEAATGKGKDPESIKKAWIEKQERRAAKNAAKLAEIQAKPLVKNDVRHTLRTLTPEQVREIRESRIASSTLHTAYGCSASTINKIRRGVIYKDII